MKLHANSGSPRPYSLGKQDLFQTQGLIRRVFSRGPLDDAACPNWEHITQKFCEISRAFAHPPLCLFWPYLQH